MATSNPKGIRMQKAQAMGMKPKMTTSGNGNPYTVGNAGKGDSAGKSKTIPSSMPFKSQSKVAK